MTACNNVILVDMWWNPALEVSFLPLTLSFILIERCSYVPCSVPKCCFVLFVFLWGSSRLIVCHILSSSMVNDRNGNNTSEQQDQAYDRAHRFGQTRDVNIYKLMIPDTVESRILQVSVRWIQPPTLWCDLILIFSSHPYTSFKTLNENSPRRR